MNRSLFIIVCFFMAAISALALYLGTGGVVLFHPAGAISKQEMALIWLSLRLMLLVVVPVFILTGAIAWHYRASNTRARYLPNWDHSRTEEAVWWLVPFVIITVLAVVTWQSAHSLDPYKPLTASSTPLEVQVVSLNWKWLFIYPDQGIATVNQLEIPAGTPVHFSLTSDAPMNALWIPQLSGQEMTMPGMTTQLSIMADQPGTYRGLSANYSGDGFAGMHFDVRAVSPSAFDDWVAQVKASGTVLDKDSYAALAAPSSDVPPASYVLGDDGLYTGIVMKYMMPEAKNPAPAMQGGSMSDMPGMHM